MPLVVSTSILEKLAEEVARDVNPPDEEPQAGEASGERGSPIAIITLIMGIIQSLMQNCPQPASKKRLAIRKPERRQEAALWKETYSQCSCAGMKSLAGPIFNSIKAKGSQLSDPDAMALIRETADDGNLLI